MTHKFEGCEGGCDCGSVRYRVKSEPLIVHCCHCRGCQRQTGAAFAVNALIESDCVEQQTGETEEFSMATPSGKGQTITRCRTCKVAIWSNYHMNGLRDKIRFIRVGTLDSPDLMPPDVHIFTATKQPWVVLPPNDPAVSVFYKYETTWKEDSLKRRAALFEAAGIDTPQNSMSK